MPLSPLVAGVLGHDEGDDPSAHGDEVAVDGRVEGAAGEDAVGLMVLPRAGEVGEFEEERGVVVEDPVGG